MTWHPHFELVTYKTEKMAINSHGWSSWSCLSLGTVWLITEQIETKQMSMDMFNQSTSEMLWKGWKWESSTKSLHTITSRAGANAGRPQDNLFPAGTWTQRSEALLTGQGFSEVAGDDQKAEKAEPGYGGIGGTCQGGLAGQTYASERAWLYRDGCDGCLG